MDGVAACEEWKKAERDEGAGRIVSSSRVYAPWLRWIQRMFRSYDTAFFLEWQGVIGQITD
jgi:hypothetical protein